MCKLMHILYVNTYLNSHYYTGQKVFMTFRVERVGAFSGQFSRFLCFCTEQTPSNVDLGSFSNCLAYFQKILPTTSRSSLNIQLVLGSTHIQHIHVFTFCFWSF